MRCCVYTCVSVLMTVAKSSEVEPRISAESLAALVMFSKRTDRVDLLNFYPKEGKKIGYDPANWEGGIVPRALLAVMDRGRFELNVPGLPHLCSNIFLMSKRSSVYLRGLCSLLYSCSSTNLSTESVGTLHRIPSTKNTELQIIRKDLQSAPVSSHSTWTDIYQQVREGRHPQAHWVVAAPSVCYMVPSFGGILTFCTRILPIILQAPVQ